MKHQIYGNQLHRPTHAAKALYRSLVAEVLEHGRIETTLNRAKAAIRPLDRVINLGKTDTIAARRQIVKIMGNDRLLDRIYKDVTPHFVSRTSGFSRIVKLGPRLADAARLVVLELIDLETTSKAVALEVAPVVQPASSETPVAEVQSKPARKSKVVKTAPKTKATKATK